MKIGINGFGRIGRLILRQGIQSKKLEFVAINSAAGSVGAAHLLKYDSVYGKFSGKIKVIDENHFSIDGKKVLVFSERNPEKIDWKKMNVDLVLECTGKFNKKEEASIHLKSGAKKVIITAPTKGEEVVPSIVLGVNDKKIPQEDILDVASCTTNCLMPILKVLKEKFGIKRVFMTTIHAYTRDQNIVDNRHKDLRRARAAALNIIPTTTGASKAAAKIIPDLLGKVEGLAIRVPVPSGSLVSLVAELEKNTTVKEINTEMEKASKGDLKGILEYTQEPIVSSDVIGNTHSSVFDALLTKVLGGNLVNILAWYDNEIGYAQRVVELAEKLS